MGEAFIRLQDLGVLDAELATKLRKAVGFRNIAVHSYQDIDWAIVYAICTKDLDDFKSFSRAIANHCQI